MSITQYFTDELNHSLNKVIEDIYPERQIMQGLAGSLQENPADSVPVGLLPFNTSVPAYENTFNYEIYTSAGIAEFYTGAADDIPQVSRGRQKVYGKIEPVALGDSWTYYDLMRDQAKGGGMIATVLRDIRRGTDQKLENVAWRGSTDYGLGGFLNFPGVPSNFLPGDGTGSSTTFGSKTSAQKYRDLVTMSQAISSTTKNVFNGSVMLLSLRNYNDLSNARLSTTGDSGDTVLEVFERNQKNNPFGISQIIPCPFLDGKGVFPNTDMAIIYNRNAEHIETYVPDYFRVFDSVSDSAGGKMSNFKASLSVISSTGGTVVYKPLSMMYYTGT